MKRLAIILACLALVSCLKDERIVPGGDVPIGFTPMTGNNATKAEVYGEQSAKYDKKNSSKYEKFTTFAKFTGTADNPQQTSGAEYFLANGVNGVECAHGGSGTNDYDYWAPTTTYYWPKAGYLSFHAISPSNLSPYSGNVSHSWSSGFTITDFTAGTNRNQQIDLLYSDFVFNKKRSDYNPETGVPYDESSEDAGYNHQGVNLCFHHALSSVEFYFKTDADYTAGNVKYYFRVRKIELLYANHMGIFHENRTNAGDNTFADAPSGSITFNHDNSLTATPYWTPAAYETTYTVSDLSNNPAVISSSANRVGSQLLVMPQHLTHSSNNVSVKIYYYFTYQVGSETPHSYPVDNPNLSALTTDFFNITIPLAGMHGSIGGTDYTINQWLINHKYTYTIVFHLDPLIFDPYISADWVDVSSMDINLPHVE